MDTEVNITLGAEGSKSYGQRQRSKSAARPSVTQPYLIGTALKPAQLLDKDPATLSQVVAEMPPRGFDFDLCLLHTPGTFNICTIRGYWIDGKFHMNRL